MYDILIVGGGAAGLTAGLYAARAGLKTGVIESGFAGGQASTTDRLENYPGFPDGVGGPELMMSFEQQASRFGMETIAGQAESLRLTGLEKNVMVDGTEYSARSIILAMGAKPRKLGVPGEEENIGRGVSYCATCDGALYRGKTVAVMGGGDTAVEDVNFLTQYAKVFWLHRRASLRAMGRAADRALAHPQVTQMFSRTILGIRREDARLTLDLSSGDTLSVDGLFIAVGTQPMTELARGLLPLTKDGYIIAGEDTVTAIPGVFCAGDCRQKPLRQVITASADGAVAAFMAARYLSEQ